MWKLLGQSTAGTSHARAGSPCQDQCLAEVVATSCGPVAILACADGAGSAAISDVGARLACDAVARAVRDDLRDGQTLAGVDRDSVVSWLERARGELRGEGERRRVAPRQLACTFLLAVVGDEGAAFAQVGDGAILVRDGDRYRPVFWPQGGEYANITNFVTDADYARRLDFEHRPGRVDELALMTDGLQRLALDFEARTGHAPFFLPLFQRLRQADDADALIEPLRQFLDSPRINQRSDDDKTLILATRVPPRAPESETR